LACTSFKVDLRVFSAQALKSLLELRPLWWYLCQFERYLSFERFFSFLRNPSACLVLSRRSINSFVMVLRIAWLYLFGPRHFWLRVARHWLSTLLLFLGPCPFIDGWRIGEQRNKFRVHFLLPACWSGTALRNYFNQFYHSRWFPSISPHFYIFLTFFFDQKNRLSL